MTGLEGCGEACQNRSKHRDDFPEIGGQKEQDRLPDILINSSSLPHCFFDGGKVIVCEYQIRSISCHIGSLFAHCNAYIRCLQGWRIIDTVSCHCNRFSLLLQGFHNSDLMLGGNPCKYPDVFHFLTEFLIRHSFHLTTGHTFTSVLCYTEFPCNCKRCIHMVSCDHHSINMCPSKAFHRIPCLRSWRIDHPYKSQKDQIFLVCQIPLLLHCNGKHTQSLSSHPCCRVLCLPLCPCRKRHLFSMHETGLTQIDHLLRSTLNVRNLFRALPMHGSHSFAFRIKGSLIHTRKASFQLFLL